MKTIWYGILFVVAVLAYLGYTREMMGPAVFTQLAANYTPPGVGRTAY
jgi:hypothetical protein